MAAMGSQKLAVLLCKFSDTADVEQHPKSFYDDLFVGREKGGLNDYWVDASLGSLNLDGSKVFGWKTLEMTREKFLEARPGRWDKIQGALDAFPKVVASEFAGVVAIFNTGLGDAGSQGGVLAGPDDVNVTFLAHETGHLFGLSHSFDQSNRKTNTWSGPGEYFDSYDTMSAMNCSGDWGHRFSPRGPLLNVAHLERMGWLPPARVWRNGVGNSSTDDTIDLVALEHPGIPGYLAAEFHGIYVEFRINEGWDSGLSRPTVLLHQRSDPNTLLLASDEASFDNEWQPGQAFGPTPLQLSVLGGHRIEILSFNLARKTARIRLRHVAREVRVAGPGRTFGGVTVGGGGVLILPNGHVIPIPPHSPVLILTEGHALLGGRDPLASVGVVIDPRR